MFLSSILYDSEGEEKNTKPPTSKELDKRYL